jgi:glycosyltransferase involved in cell wall biosynthesis
LSDYADGTHGDEADNAARLATVTVIIPCRDATHLHEAMDSLARQQGTEFDVIVVDGSSEGDISSRLEAWRDRLELRVVTGARGAPAGAQRNRGVGASRGRFLIFVDADDVVAEGYVRAMAETLRSHEFVCCSTDVQKLNPWNPEGTVPQRHGLNRSEMRFLPFAGAGTLGIRRSLFEWVGGFDPSLDCYEEADLCWRLQLAGHDPPTFVAGAVLHIRLEADRAKRWRKAVLFGRTQALLYRRYRSRGMPRESISAAAAAWIGLLQRWVRRLTGQAERGLAWETSLRFGRLQGSFRHRVAFL